MRTSAGARWRATLCTLVIFVFGSETFAQTPNTSLCTPAGYTLGFFNGVWNTYSQAVDGMLALQALLPATYNNLPVSAEVFYNHTGCGSASTCLQDLAEVFIQKAQEQDTSNTLSTQLEFFWETLGSSDSSFTSTVSTLLSSAQSIFQTLTSSLVTQEVAGISALVSNPPTAADYAVIDARLDALALEGQMFLLVAHSQGNLFVNQAYSHIAPTVGAASVKVEHIAPASATLNGPYELNSNDLVINALRALLGPSSVPAANLTFAINTTDPSGHELIPSYLSPSGGLSAITNDLMASLAALTPPIPSTGTGQSAVGFFTVTLTWSGMGDEDLHVFEPGGAHVYYANKQGQAGYLDTDNTVGLGPEHYFASCDATVLETGTYQVGINNYNGADNETATIQVASSANGVLKTKQMNTGATIGPAGDNSPIPILQVIVSKDATTGAFSVTAQ